MTKRKKRRTRPGARPSPALLVFAAVTFLSLFCVPGTLAQSGRGKRAEQKYAVVAGTVFRDDGRALPGAEVTVSPDPEAGSRTKQKAVSVTTNSRGEFAVRVPAAPMRYNVNIKAKGFLTQYKSASISGDERVDIFFQLEREAPQE